MKNTPGKLLWCISFFGRRRLRRMMRGYRTLSTSGDLATIATIKRDLTAQELDIDKGCFSKRFFGAGIIPAELILRQYLLIRIGGLTLNRALLIAASDKNGKVVYPLPSVWRKTIERGGFKVSNLKSGVLWWLYILAATLYGYFCIFRVVLGGLSRRRLRQRNKCTTPYVYFYNLAAENTPQTIIREKNYDIISWYLQWSGRMLGIEAVHHSVKTVPDMSHFQTHIRYQADSLPDLWGVNEIVCYLGWVVGVTMSLFFDALRGRWWHALLLNQAALMAKARIVPKAILAREYLFHQSGNIYRPLWTYEAERKGSTVSFYFYSMNSQGFRRANGDSPIHWGYKAMNWSRYLVWSENQANFVRKATGNGSKIEVVGPIWFSDSGQRLLGFERPAVAIFDVQPQRASIYEASAYDFDYYTPKVVAKFLLDVSEVLEDNGCMMVHKRKREIHRQAHPKYRKTLQLLADSKRYIMVDPSLSAFKVIRKSNAVISMPFTSTAFIGRYCGVPSVFYDPYCILDSDDPASDGIAIIQNRNDLEDWLLRILPTIRGAISR